MNGQRIAPDDLKPGQFLILKYWQEAREVSGLFGSSTTQPARSVRAGPYRVLSVLLPFLILEDHTTKKRETIEVNQTSLEMWHVTREFADLLLPQAKAER